MVLCGCTVRTGLVENFQVTGVSTCNWRKQAWSAKRTCGSRYEASMKVKMISKIVDKMDTATREMGNEEGWPSGGEMGVESGRVGSR